MGSRRKIDRFACKIGATPAARSKRLLETLVQKIVVTDSCFDAGVVAVIVFVIAVVMMTIVVSTNIRTIEFRGTAPPGMLVNN